MEPHNVLLVVLAAILIAFLAGYAMACIDAEGLNDDLPPRRDEPVDLTGRRW